LLLASLELHVVDHLVGLIFTAVLGYFALHFILSPSPKHVAQKVVELVRQKKPAPFAPAEAIKDPRIRAEALACAHRLLRFEELFEEASEALRLAASADPTRWMAVWLPTLPESAPISEAAAKIREILHRKPEHSTLRAALANALRIRGQTDEAIELVERWTWSDPALTVIWAQLLAEQGRDREAISVLDQLIESLNRQLRANIMRDTAAQESLRAAEALSDDLRSGILGQEARVEAALARGRLDRWSGANFRLIGQSLMARSPQIATHTRLASLPDDEARSARLLASQPYDPAASCLQGMCKLRNGLFEEAAELFKSAREADSSWFPASLGLGAVMTLQQARAWSALEDLEECRLPEGLAVVLPDLGALTHQEKRCVAASASPLRAVLPRLAQRGIHLWILPLDVRPTDLSELADLDTVRSSDGRALRAIDGMATPKLAVSRIEDLLDTVSDHGWVLAHELAHLVFFHLPPSWRDEVIGLHLRALGSSYACTQYAQKNPDEFFAVAFVDWLNIRYHRPSAPILDDQGIVAAVMSVFDLLNELRDDIGDEGESLSATLDGGRAGSTPTLT
jgi:tetratricopeptide (TPR) repeat protein